MTPNILFIMYDQLRFDYLSCAGHPHIETPNFDRVAANGVRFTRAYAQSPVCGSSRMSTYTGRYVSSHGAQYNGYPLRVGEWTLGDHLRRNGTQCWLIGKTHMAADAQGMERLGLTPDSIIGARQVECGFDPWVRDDGLWPEGPDGPYDQSRSPYNEFLKSRGYESRNPWAENANAVLDDGAVATGFVMRHAGKAANIEEQDSETPWLTDRAIEFLDQAKGPWCAHLSYIKPHWPYIVPAPYNSLYGPDDVIPANKHASERDAAHPVYAAFMNSRIGRAFSREDVRNTVIPAYMGLIKQCDDQLGRLLDHLEATGRADRTIIVLTADHGDYLGDHWMGEKDFFHNPSVRIPLIISDPSAAADETRGTICNHLVESIDLVPTFIEMIGGTIPSHIVEGHSLVPFLVGEEPRDWRTFAVSEYDYALSPMCEALGVEPRDARLFMIVTERWKLIHAEGGFRPLLFDLLEDPDEINDLGSEAAFTPVIDELYRKLAQWARRMSQRVTMSDEEILKRRGASARKGILLGVFDETDVDAELFDRK